MKKLCLFLGVLAITLIVASNLTSVNAQNEVEYPGGAEYLGPVCQNSSGTYYCCKNSAGSCDKPATCPSCQ